MLLGLTACAASIPQSQRVRDVTILGRQDIDEDELTGGLANHPPAGLIFIDYAAYDPNTLKLDIKRVESFYRARGYFSAKVVDSRVDPQPDGVRITLVVEAGVPSVLTTVAIVGAPEETNVTPEWLIDTTEMKVGEPFDYEAYERAIEILRARLLTAGFAFAHIEGEARVHRDKRTVVAHFRVKAGPLAHFGKVQIKGLERVPESLIRNRLSWKPGDVFSPLLIEQTRGRIYATGLIANVRFDWDHQTKGDTVDILIRASEGKRRQIRLGLGFGIDQSRYELRAQAGYTHRSFVDPLLTVRMSTRPAYQFFGDADGFEVESSAEAERQDFFIPRVTFTGRASYRVTNLEAYNTLGPTVSGSIDRGFANDRLRVGIGGGMSYLNVTSIDDAVNAELQPRIGLFDPLAFVFVQPELTWDQRDDPRNPRRGYYAAVSVEGGWIVRKQVEPYALISPELRGYLPLGSRIVLAGRARLASRLFNMGPLPAPRRFFAGGANTQRGFSGRQLSEYVSKSSTETIPVGGEAMVQTNLELRLQVARLFGNWFGVVGFADGADVKRTVGDIDITNLHWAAGGGVRYHTPIGAIRLDFGVRLNRTGAGEPNPRSRYAFHLSLGEAF